MNVLSRTEVECVDGIYELIDMLLENNIKIAVGTASNTRYAISVLEKLNIYNKFESIVTGDMVQRGKPDPAIFLLAAENIAIDPKDCLVIEDGISGMIAAKSANMKCIALVKKIDFDTYPSKNQVLSLSEITKEYLEGI